MGRNVGIRDVALAAGVSVTTVSHVLNEVASARISPGTRDKVRSAASQLGYGPNRLAQALRGRRTSMLGLVLGGSGDSDCDAGSARAGLIISGATDAARSAGYALLVVRADGTDREIGPADVDLLLERQVDGVLYVPDRMPAPNPPGNLNQVPAVLIDAAGPGTALHILVPDEYQGACAAVGTLLVAGHKRVAFLDGGAFPSNSAAGRAASERLRGFRDSLTRSGLDGNQAQVEQARPDAAGGYRAARRVLQVDNPPTALFCCNDRMAAGAYRAAGELGLSVPADLSIVGFGNEEPLAASLYPPLTSVALPHHALGMHAVEQLVQILEAPPSPTARPQTTRLDCTLVRRESVAGPRR